MEALFPAPHPSRRPCVGQQRRSAVLGPRSLCTTLEPGSAVFSLFFSSQRDTLQSFAILIIADSKHRRASRPVPFSSRQRIPLQLATLDLPRPPIHAPSHEETPCAGLRRRHPLQRSHPAQRSRGHGRNKDCCCLLLLGEAGRELLEECGAPIASHLTLRESLCPSY